jgi:hypothetical protein
MQKEGVQQILTCYRQEGKEFLKCTVAIDEMWIHESEPELKLQSAQWEHQPLPRPSKCPRQQSKIKHVVITASDCVGVITTDHVPFSSSVTCDFLKPVPEIRVYNFGI